MRALLLWLIAVPAMAQTMAWSEFVATAVERAIAMSHEKYCSASIMLGKTAEITTSFDVIEA